MSCGQIALAELGIPIKKYYAYEIKSHAIKVTQLNFPNTVQLGNINDFDSDYFKNIKIDLFLCGSPCQDLSSARGAREGVKGKKSSLIYKCVEILKQIKPKYFLFENVGSMSHKNREIFNAQ